VIGGNYVGGNGADARARYDPRMNTAVGRLLRDWRAARGMSQLDLAMRAGFSSRHVSFIETGRSQPSREALLALAETLDVPLRERNRLLEAGGYAHLYRQTALDAQEMRHVREVLQFILKRHEPYGAVVLDRHSDLLMSNEPAARLLGALVDRSLMSARPNVLRMICHPLGACRFIVNWPEVARHLMDRAERELTLVPERGEGGALLSELRGYVEGVKRAPRAAALTPADVLLPVHLKKDDLEVRIFSAIMTIGTPQDVTLQELRIETFFPADEPSRAVLQRLHAPDVL
jgi:transcriptional regulator with XRE-family HTH domain